MGENNLDSNFAIESPSSESAVVQMYEVSGFGPPNYEKYLECKRSQEPLMNVLIQNRRNSLTPPTELVPEQKDDIPHQDELNNKLRYIGKIPIESRARLIHEGLDSGDVKLQLAASDAMMDVPEEDLDMISRKLVEIAGSYLDDLNSSLHVVAAKMIESVIDEIEVTKLRQKLLETISRDISNDDINAQINAVRLVPYLAEEDRASIISTALKRPNEQIQYAAAGMIEEVPDEMIEEPIRVALNSSNVRAQLIASEQIAYVEDDNVKQELQKLVTKDVRTWLSTNSNPEIQAVAAQMIGNADQENVYDLIMMALENGDRSIGETALISIYRLNQQQISNVIQRALSHKSPDIQLGVLPYISYCVEEKQLVYDSVIDMIRTKFESDGRQGWKFAVDMLRRIPQDFRQNRLSVVKDCIDRCLHDPNDDLRRFGLAILEYADEADKAKLLAEIFNLGMGEMLVGSSLYKDQPDMNNDVFSRRNFPKTDGQTILIGGPLKDRIVVKKMSIRRFKVWQKLYEDYQLWHDQGFNYIPIEPIQSFRVNNEGGMTIFTGVLDINLGKWKRISGGLYQEELDNAKYRILDGLNKKRVQHGHPHEMNFCLRFFRNDKGQPDVTIPPRLYLIDFDLAY